MSLPTGETSAKAASRLGLKRTQLAAKLTNKKARPTPKPLKFR